MGFYLFTFGPWILAIAYLAFKREFVHLFPVTLVWFVIYVGSMLALFLGATAISAITLSDNKDVEVYFDGIAQHGDGWYESHMDGNGDWVVSFQTFSGSILTYDRRDVKIEVGESAPSFYKVCKDPVGLGGPLTEFMFGDEATETYVCKKNSDVILKIPQENS